MSALNARQKSMLTGLSPIEAADVQQMSARLLDRLDGEDDYLAVRSLLTAAHQLAGARYPLRTVEQFRRTMTYTAAAWEHRRRSGRLR